MFTPSATLTEKFLSDQEQLDIKHTFVDVELTHFSAAHAIQSDTKTNGKCLGTIRVRDLPLVVFVKLLSFVPREAHIFIFTQSLPLVMYYLPRPLARWIYPQEEFIRYLREQLPAGRVQAALGELFLKPTPEAVWAIAEDKERSLQIQKAGKKIVAMRSCRNGVKNSMMILAMLSLCSEIMLLFKYCLDPQTLLFYPQALETCSLSKILIVNSIAVVSMMSGLWFYSAMYEHAREVENNQIKIAEAVVNATETQPEHKTMLTISSDVTLRV